MTLPAQDIVERLRSDASGIDDLADDGNFPAHFLERARIYSENAATGADAIERQARNIEMWKGQVERQSAELTRLHAVERQFAEALAERDDLATTIKRVWAALGNPSYESLNGLTIGELVADTQQNYVDANEAHLDCIRVLERIADARMPGEARRLAVEQLRSSRSASAESRVSALSAEVERLRLPEGTLAKHGSTITIEFDSAEYAIRAFDALEYAMSAEPGQAVNASLNGGSDHD